MRLPTTLLLLPLATTILAQQNPLQGYIDKAKSYLPTALNPPIDPEDIPNPIDAGASKVAERVVERINVRNWQRKLAPKPDGEEEWMIFMTGGNKSCYGKCGPINEIWNVRLTPAFPHHEPH
jgi:hypothetical protein